MEIVRDNHGGDTLRSWWTVVEDPHDWSAAHAPSQAPGRLVDFWPTERIWAYVKNDLPKKVSKHPRWKKGVGPLHGDMRRTERH